jgi:hypothetical protein
VKKISLVLLLFISVFTQQLDAQDTVPRLRVSILTCGPGEELYSTFGHTAIRIIDSTAQTDIVYNYGNFDFNDADFYMKFTKGVLDYFLGATSFAEFMYEYQVTKRDVTEQELLLTDSAKLSIRKVLNETLFSAARFYKYDFLYDNCTSRVRDILIKYGGLQTDKLLVPEKTTFRNMLYEYLDKGNQPWSKLGIDILLASPIDIKVNKTESMFLPDYLMKGIDSSVNSNHVGLVLQKKILNNGASINPGNPKLPLYLFSAFAMIMAVISFASNKPARTLTRILDFSLLLITGLIGVLLVLLWFGTDRQVHDSNYNLLWALPTNAIAAFAIWKKPSWLRKYFTVSSFIYAITLLLWAWLPQELNISLVPIVILLLFRSLALKRSA